MSEFEQVLHGLYCRAAENRTDRKVGVVPPTPPFDRDAKIRERVKRG